MTIRRPAWFRRARSRAGLACGAACVTLLAPLVAAADAAGNWEHGPHAMWGGGWGGMAFGFLMMIAFVAAIVVMVVLVVRALGGAARSGPARTTPPGKTPLDILEERFANGEIDRQDFEERRRVLGDRSNSA
jgi:putative membrane protein